MLQKLMKRTAVLVCLFSMMTLGLIIGLSTTKLVTITEVAQDEVVGTGNTIVPQTSSADSENALAFDTETATDYLCIPLPEGRRDHDRKSLYGSGALCADPECTEVVLCRACTHGKPCGDRCWILS